MPFRGSSVGRLRAGLGFDVTSVLSPRSLLGVRTLAKMRLGLVASDPVSRFGSTRQPFISDGDPKTGVLQFKRV